MKKAMLALFLLGVTFQAHAEYKAEEMVRNCKAFVRIMNDEPVTNMQVTHAAHCKGFLHGFFAGLKVAAHQAYGDVPNDERRLIGNEYGNIRVKGLWSIPPNMTDSQYAKVFIKYLDEHPESLHFDVAILMTLALEDAFPDK